MITRAQALLVMDALMTIVLMVTVAGIGLAAQGGCTPMAQALVKPNVAGLNVRAGPTTESQIIGSVTARDGWLDVAESSASGGWLRLCTGGWVSASYVMMRPVPVQVQATATPTWQPSPGPSPTRIDGTPAGGVWLNFGGVRYWCALPCEMTIER